MSTTDDIITETPEAETEEDFLNAEEDLVEQRDQTSFDITELGELVKVASEGALTSKTVSNYRRYLLPAPIELSFLHIFSSTNMPLLACGEIFCHIWRPSEGPRPTNKVTILENQLLNTSPDGFGGNVKVLILRIPRHRSVKARRFPTLLKCALLSVTITPNKLEEVQKNGIRINLEAGLAIQRSLILCPDI